MSAAEPAGWCESLYRAKASELILYGRALGLSHGEAEDVVQETFVALMRRSAAAGVAGALLPADLPQSGVELSPQLVAAPDARAGIRALVRALARAKARTSAPPCGVWPRCRRTSARSSC